MLVTSTVSYRLSSAERIVRNGHIKPAIRVYEKIIRRDAVLPEHQRLESDRMRQIRSALVPLLLSDHREYAAAEVIRQGLEGIADNAWRAESFLNEDHDALRFGIALFRAGLPSMSLKVFEQASRRNPEEPLPYYLMALVHQKCQNSVQALKQLRRTTQLLDRLIEVRDHQSAPYWGDAYFRTATALEDAGNLDRAKDYYQKAVKVSGYRAVESYQGLHRLFTRSGRGQEADQIKRILRTLKPQHELQHRIDNGLIFLGYSLDPKEFELVNRGTVVFFWETLRPTPELRVEDTDSGKTVRIGKRIYEVKQVENFAPDFGFETGGSGQGFPPGWPSDYYSAKPNQRSIAWDILPVGRSRCLLLSNTRLGNTNCQTDYIPVNDTDLYLQAGWIKSINGRAFLGRMWFDEDKNSNGYDYVALDIKNPEWKYYKQIVRPQPGSSFCRLWVTNFMTTGRAFFDDIVFLKLHIPS